jgi:cytochrome c
MVRMLAAIATVTLLLFGGTASATDNGTKEEAVAMVKRVEAMFAKDGAEATFKAVSDKSNTAFHDRDLYPFIYDMKGVCVAHGARPALIGKNLIDLKDQDGKYLIQEMVALAKGPGSGWIDRRIH